MIAEANRFMKEHNIKEDEEGLEKLDSIEFTDNVHDRAKDIIEEIDDMPNE
jgi:hypothetical protein